MKNDETINLGFTDLLARITELSLGVEEKEKNIQRLKKKNLKLKRTIEKVLRLKKATKKRKGGIYEI